MYLWVEQRKFHEISIAVLDYWSVSFFFSRDDDHDDDDDDDDDDDRWKSLCAFPWPLMA